MKNDYLYGADTLVPEIPAEIIMRRIELLDDHLAALLEVDFKHRDSVRVNAVLKATKFWETINEH